MKSLIAAATAAGLLAGCAAFNTLVSDVSSFGDWPAGRAPGTYAFERLPSQQAYAQEAARVEEAARRAVERAGFRPAPPGQEPEVVVQVGARASRTVLPPWDDPLWWRGGFGAFRRGPWVGPTWGWTIRYAPERYEREVGLLLRDRASGKPLYEARAANEGNFAAEGAVLAAMFEAALSDFPRSDDKPHPVRVTLTP